MQKVLTAIFVLTVGPCLFAQSAVTVDTAVAPCSFHTSSYVTSSTCTLSNVKKGDLLLCSLGYGDLGYSASISDSLNGGWLLGTAATGGGVYHDLMGWWARPNSVAGSPTITIRYNSPTNSAGGGCFAVQGARATGWIDPNVAEVYFTDSNLSSAVMPKVLMPRGSGELIYSNLSTAHLDKVQRTTDFTLIAAQTQDQQYSAYSAQSTQKATLCPFGISPNDSFMIECIGILPASAAAGVDPYQGMVVTFSKLGSSPANIATLCASTSGSGTTYFGGLADCGEPGGITGWDVVNIHSAFKGSTAGPTSRFSKSLWLPSLNQENYIGDSTTNLTRTTGESGDWIGAGISPAAPIISWGGYVQTNIPQNDRSGNSYYVGGLFANGEYQYLELTADGSKLTAAMSGQGYANVPIGTFATNTTYWVTGQFNENGTEYMSLYTGCPSSCTLVRTVSHADGAKGVPIQSLTFGSPRFSTESAGHQLWWRNFKTCPDNSYPCLP